VVTVEKFAPALRQLGLDTLEGARRFQAHLIKNHKGRRDIQRIAAGTAGLPVTLFIKRNWRPYKGDGVRQLLTRGRVRSQSRVEWDNARALRQAGIAVAEPVACGEECSLLWEKFSFIVTAAATGEMTLHEFIHRRPEATERRIVFRALARFVRRLHDAGFASPDLFARHLFLSRQPEPAFCLIDMARLDHSRSTSPRRRARDLAALNSSIPLALVPMRERLRFLSEYGDAATLQPRVTRRMEYLLKNRKRLAFRQSAA
jgi:tRNA A-37 threonylcarbamoyl transferase component Bud32